MKLPVCRIRSDHGTEFTNSTLENFLSDKGINHNFFAPHTPQQNGVVERRNRTLVEVARSMLNLANLPLYLWAGAVATACFTRNRCIINRRLNKTPYEAMNGRKPSIYFFHVFGAQCFVKNNKTQLNKFQPNADEAIFLGYSLRSKAFRVLNRRTQVIEENIDVSFEDHYIRNTEYKHVTTHIMESDAPPPGSPDIQVIYDVDIADLFCPIETTHLSERRSPPVSLAPEVISDSGPTPSTTNASTLNINLPPVEGESGNNSSNSNSTPTGAPQVEGESPTTVPTQEQEQPIPEFVDNNIFQNNDDEASEVRPPVQGESPSEDIHVQGEEHNNVEDIYSSAAVETLPRLHIWTRDHPPNQVFGNPSAGAQTRSSIDIQNECHFAAFFINHRAEDNQ